MLTEILRTQLNNILLVDAYFLFSGELTRHIYESMRREASCLRIQTDLRMYLARKMYKELCSSAVSVQTGMRGMSARNELRFRRQTKAAIMIQVFFIFWFV